MNYEDNKPVPGAPVDACVGCDGEACRCEGCRSNLHSCNWLDGVPGNDFDIVEVHFKNTRRGFYRNSAHLDLHEGDWVAVEAQPGHDVGQVAMTGQLVRLQMRRANLKPDAEILRVFRKAKPTDIERYNEAKAREVDTMIRSRKIAVDLGLKMKIGDVEYQGDGNKAIFYYIADERVDFRQLIKVLAEVFHIRVEMKQIGARQEAGRIGGIGPCGRPLCCASWMANFVSVSTSAARFQDVSLNPQKLAGQCAKLKCCLNFEVDTYLEAIKKMPPRDVVLETTNQRYYHFKSDIFKGEMTYSTKKGQPVDTVTVSIERVAEVMALNDNGVKPDQLLPDGQQRQQEQKAFGDILGQDAINRFDKKKKKRKGKPQQSKGKPAPDHESHQDKGPAGDDGKPRREPRKPRGGNNGEDKRGKAPRGNRDESQRQPGHQPRRARNHPHDGNDRPKDKGNASPQSVD